MYTSARIAGDFKHCISLGAFYKMIISNALVENEMVIANSVLRASFMAIWYISNPVRANESLME